MPDGSPFCVIVMLEVPLATEKEVNAMGTLAFDPLIVMDPEDGEAVQPLVSAQTL